MTAFASFCFVFVVVFFFFVSFFSFFFFFFFLSSSRRSPVNRLRISISIIFTLTFIASRNEGTNSFFFDDKDGDDDAEKYKRRTSMATRQMQKVLPYAYSKKLNPAGSGNNEGLDDSYEDEETLLAASAGKKKRKNFSGSSSSGGKKSWFSDPRAIVVAVSLISCLLTMVLLYQRVSMLESEIDSARNAGGLKTDGMKKKESRTRMAIEKIEKAALEAEEAGEMYVPEA